MRKYYSFVLFSFLLVLFCISNVCVASAAMRNLLSEFNNATNIFTYDNSHEAVGGLNKNIDYEKSLNQIDGLIKQGLHVDDAVGRACYLALNISYLYKKGSSEELNRAEAFCIALIKRLAKAKADFKEVLGEKFLGSKSKEAANNLTNNLLKTLLEAGADPNKYSGKRSLLNEIFHDSPYNESQKNSPKWNDQKAKMNLERAKMLIEHKVSLGSLSYNYYVCGSNGDTAMAELLKNTYLRRMLNGYISVEDEKKQFEYISNMLELLRNAGADPKDAKKYLDGLREEYRNTPEALKYIDRVEKLINKSSFCSLGNVGLLNYGILFLSVLIAKKRSKK